MEVEDRNETGKIANYKLNNALALFESQVSLLSPWWRLVSAARVVKMAGTARYLHRYHFRRAEA